MQEAWEQNTFSFSLLVNWVGLSVDGGTNLTTGGLRDIYVYSPYYYLYIICTRQISYENEDIFRYCLAVFP